MFEAVLPHGVERGGAWRRDALLRRPTGADEALLVDEARGASAAVRVSLLLARCVTSLGDVDAGLAEVRALTVGDRETLLLALRIAAFGDALACVVDCPACDERMDLELSASGLLVEPYADVSVWHEVDGVEFRLPTGADVEAAAEADDVEAGAALLLARCVASASAGSLEPAVADAVAAEMARLDPQAELRLAAVCPECGEPVDALLDAGALVLDELAGSADGLFREVHALARHYHWSEGEILGLELGRRRRYLELLVADEAAEGVAL